MSAWKLAPAEIDPFKEAQKAGRVPANYALETHPDGSATVYDNNTKEDVERPTSTPAHAPAASVAQACPAPADPDVRAVKQTDGRTAFYNARTDSFAETAALAGLEGECKGAAVPCDTVSEWLAEPDEPEQPIVEGIIDTGDRVAIVGQSKAKKSFFVLQLALSIATGTPFLGHKVTLQRVLLVNGEIRRAPYKKRVRRMVKAMRLDPTALGGLVVIHTCDQVPDKEPLRRVLEQATEHRCQVAGLDPFYTCVGDESDQAEVKKAVEAMKMFAADGVTLVSVFHSSKGNIGDRQAIDRISGSGIFARDASTMLTLCEHASELNHVVLTTVCRNHPPKEAQTIHFNEGAFEPSDVAAVEKTGRTRTARKVDPSTVAACFTEKPLAYNDALEAIKTRCGVGTNLAKGFLREAVTLGSVSVTTEGRNTFYTKRDTV